jgi:hypothetical protein
MGQVEHISIAECHFPGLLAKVNDLHEPCVFSTPRFACLPLGFRNKSKILETLHITD